jgi:transposase
MGSATNTSAVEKDPSMHHRNAPRSVESRRRLVQRCQARPIAPVSAEMGISRQYASKWVNRWHRHGEAGLLDRPSVPHPRPAATPAPVVARIEQLRHQRWWSARRIANELAAQGITISARTVGRHLLHLGSTGADSSTPPATATAGHDGSSPAGGHMVHLDVKKTGQISGAPSLSDLAQMAFLLAGRGDHAGLLLHHAGLIEIVVWLSAVLANYRAQLAN